MAMTLVWSLLVLATLVWLVTGIWKSSRPWAVATMMLGPLAAVVPAVRERHNPDTRVTVPFLAHLAFTVLLGISVVTAVQQAWREEAAEKAALAAQAAQAAQGAEAEQVSAGAESSQTRDGAASFTLEDDLPRDPVERLSHHLREAGLRHAVLPLETGTTTPRGATHAVRLNVTAPADDGRQLNALLLRCADCRACHRLAGSAKAGRLSGPAVKGSPSPQVTQNGFMLLVVTPAAELEGLHHVVQGVFRRTRFVPT